MHYWRGIMSNLYLVFVLVALSASSQIISVSCQSVIDHENELIKLISEKSGIKFIVLVSSDDNSDESQHNLIHIQKNLSETSYFTSVWNLKSLEENNSILVDSRALIVLHLIKGTSENLSSISKKIKISRFTWLCFSFSPEVNLTYFQDIFIPFNTKLFYASLEGERIKIEEIYQTAETASQLVDYYGEWDASNGLSTVETEFYSRRKNFRKTPLKYMCLSFLPYPCDPCRMSSIDESTTTLECLFYEIWNELTTTFNVTSDLLMSPPVEDSFSLHVQDLLEKIKNGEIDNCMSPLMFTAERARKYNFLWPVRRTSFFIFTMVPDVEINYSSYLQPFNFNLWMATFAWFISMTAVTIAHKFVITTVLMKKTFSFMRDSADDVISSFSALCSQGVNMDVNEGMMSVRMLLIITHMVPLFLLPSYSGALISFLGNPPLRIPFFTLKEFEEQKAYKLMVVKPSFDHTYVMTNEKFAKVRKLNLLVDDNLMPINDVQGFTRVCEEKLSYFVGQPLMLKDPPHCKVYTMDEAFGLFLSAMSVNRDFPLKEQFNRVMQRRFICGLRQKHEEKIILNYLKIDLLLKGSTGFFEEANFDNVRPFSLEDVLSIFALYLVGLFLTVMVFLLEIYHHRKSAQPLQYL